MYKATLAMISVGIILGAGFGASYASLSGNSTMSTTIGACAALVGVMTALAISHTIFHLLTGKTSINPDGE